MRVFIYFKSGFSSRGIKREKGEKIRQNRDDTFSTVIYSSVIAPSFCFA